MGRFWRLWAVLVSLVVVACIRNDNTNINNNGGGGITGPGTVGVTSVIITNFPSGPIQLVCPAGSTSGQATFTFAARAEPADASQQFVWSASGGQMNASTGVWIVNQPGTYTIRATSAADQTKFTEVNVTLVDCAQPGQAPALTFTATPSSITAGQTSTLGWNCLRGVTLVKSGGWSGAAAVSGSEVVSPSQTTTYTLTCSNPYGSVTQSATVVVAKVVAQKPNVSISRTTIWGPACPASGPSRAFVSSDIPIQSWMSVPAGIVNVVATSPTAATVSAASETASGTVSIIGTTAQGRADTVQVTLNACPQTQFIVGTPPQLRIAGNGCTMVSATTPVSGGTIASVSGGDGVVQVTWSGSTVTWTPLAVGTRMVTITSTDGRTVQVPVTVVQCSAPAPIRVTVVPESQVCIAGSQATFSAVVENSQSSTAVTWTSSNTSVASIVTPGSNTVVLGCNQSGSTTVTARAVADQSASDSGVLTVNSPPAPTCPSTIDYAPAGGSLAANLNRELAVQNWPSGVTNCQPFWYLDRPDIAQVAGADNIITIDGKQYYAGIHAVLRGVSPGTVIVCVQTSIPNPEVKRCYTWTITAVQGDLVPLGAGSGSTRIKYMDVEGVSQTFKGF